MTSLSSYRESLISIIVPTYNRAHFLSDLFDSLDSQTYTFWECLIVDDRSDDNTSVLVKKKSVEDKRYRFFQRKECFTKGAQTCRNIGIQNSGGEFMMFLDSDDLLMSHCLTKRIKWLKQNPKLDFVVGLGTFCDRDMNISSKIWNIEKEEDDLTRFLYADSVWQTSGGLFKSSFIRDNEIYFDTALSRHQDVDFHIRVLMHKPTYQKYFSSEPDYIVRRHGVDSISQQRNADFSIPAFLISKKIIKYRKTFPDHESIFLSKFFYDLQNLFFHKHIRMFFNEIMLMPGTLISKLEMILLTIYTMVLLKFKRKRPSMIKSNLNKLIMNYYKYNRTIGVFEAKY